MNNKDKEQLIALYKQLSELTAPECATVCRVPHSCCSSFDCQVAQTLAKELWYTELIPVAEEDRIKPDVLFLSKSKGGCIVEPHLRPHCTKHTCAVNSLGFKVGDKKWTRAYFQLRTKIERLEGRMEEEANQG